MTDRFSELLRILGEVVAEPTANLPAALLLLAVLTIILLIFIVGAAFLLVSPSDEEEEEAEPAVEPSSPDSQGDRRTDVVGDSGSTDTGAGRADQEIENVPRVSTRLYVVIGLVLVAAALVVAYAGTSTDDYCLRCHSGLDRANSAEATSSLAPATLAHRTVPCVACHEADLPLGLPSNVSARAQHLVARVTGSTGAATPVDSQACLQCHGSIGKAVTTDSDRGIRVSHSEPIAAGMTCIGCHKEVGHLAASQQSSGMSLCIRCHDGTEASSECSVCHLGDVADASPDRLVYSRLDLAPVSDCGGCHAQDTCDACHGLRMPHSQSFLDGEHAREAGFDKKVLCWRCHTLTDCGRCHQTKDRALGYWGHGIGTGWKQLHGEGLTVDGYAGCGCHGRSPYARAGHYCKACH